jgi:hypothetical protein
MSQSCDLFYEGPQKCHPHALGFDDVIRDLRCSGVAFEGPSAKGVNLNLGVGVLCDGSGDACWETLKPTHCDYLLSRLGLRAWFLLWL